MRKMKYDHIRKVLESSKSDWKERVNCLDMLEEELDKSDPHDALRLLIKCASHLALQLNDLRSAIVSKVSLLIIKAAEKAAETQYKEFHKFSTNFIKNENLVNAIGSANKTIFQHAGNAFQALFKHDLVTLRTLEHLYDHEHKNKSGKIRERIATALFIYINKINPDHLSKAQVDHLTFLDKSISHFEEDASSKTREIAKKARSKLNILDNLQEEFKENNHSRLNTPMKLHISQSKRKPKTKSALKPLYTSLKKFNSGYKPHDDMIRIEIKRDRKIDILLSILNNRDISEDEKLNRFFNFNMEELVDQLAFKEITKLLEVLELTKLISLKDLIQNLLNKANITPFMHDMLSYIKQHNLNKKLDFRPFIQKTLKEDLSHFINFLLEHNSSFALKMLLQSFNGVSFRNLYIAEPSILNSLLTVINYNFISNKDINILTENFKLLKLITSVTNDFNNSGFCEKLNEFIQIHDPQFWININESSYRQISIQNVSYGSLNKRIVQGAKNQMEIEIEPAIEHVRKSSIETVKSAIFEAEDDEKRWKDLDQDSAEFCNGLLEIFPNYRQSEKDREMIIQKILEFIHSNQDLIKETLEWICESEFINLFLLFLQQSFTVENDNCLLTVIKSLVTIIGIVRGSYREECIKNYLINNIQFYQQQIPLLMVHNNIVIRRYATCLLILIRHTLDNQQYSIIESNLKEYQKNLIIMYGGNDLVRNCIN